MIDTPIVWQQPASEETPPLLRTWAESRGLRLVAPRAGGRRAIPVDPSVATKVEDALHRARELVTQHDAEGAERALATAEGLLRDHPELPQAAWLFAEVERGWAARFARLDPVDAGRAARAWRAAAALDGGREAGIGEVSAAPEAAVPFSIETDPARSGETGGVTLTLDGAPIAPGAHQTRPGLHQLVARAHDVPVFAEWITVAPGATIRVALPSAEPCSAADLASGAPACPSWVTARAGEGGAFVVRVCSAGSGCGPDLVVAPLPGPGLRPDGSRPQDHHVIVRHGLPTWATILLASGGVILGGIAAGAIGWAALPTTTQVVFKTNPPR